jgi:DNA (cytosine-5)-methyltransferase 1
MKRRQALKDLAGTIELLAGGPPCQGFSQAGKRRLDDPRNMLFESYLELVEILRPRLILVENVQGFKSDFKLPKRSQRTNFAIELERRLSADYDVKSMVIRACDYGVPQIRPRFFLIGAQKSAGVRAEIESSEDFLEGNVSSFLSERRLPRWPNSSDAISDLEIARNGTVPSKESVGFEAIAYRSPLTRYQKVMRTGHTGQPSDTRLARHRSEIRQRFASIIKACKDENRLGVTVSSTIRKKYKLKKMAIRVLDPKQPAPTITSLPDDLIHYSEPRILTVREIARLQSFPDWFRFRGSYTTGGHRRRREVPRFTQVANAVPPLIAEQFGFVLIDIASRLQCVEVSVDGFTNDTKCIPVLS